jgi:hypothetical protein
MYGISPMVDGEIIPNRHCRFLRKQNTCNPEQYIIFNHGVRGGFLSP